MFKKSKIKTKEQKRESKALNLLSTAYSNPELLQEITVYPDCILFTLNGTIVVLVRTHKLQLKVTLASLILYDSHIHFNTSVKESFIKLYNYLDKVTGENNEH